MSLAIAPRDVAEVLLADGWHDIERGSFDLDAYEFVDGEDILLDGGQSPPVCATGFECREVVSRTVLSGPLTSILAVRRVGQR